MDFKALQYFTAVAEAGSVSQAAKNLDMTQPPVSMAISKLEGELGVKLFERTAKGVTLTVAGAYLHSRAGRLLGERDRLAETLSLMGEGVAGTLRVGAEPMVINEFAADVLSEFLDLAPGAKVSLVDTSPDDIVRLLAMGSIDIGCVPFAPEQFDDAVHESCEHATIAEIDVRLAVPLHRRNEDHWDGSGWGPWILPKRLSLFTGIPEGVRAALQDDDTFDVIEVSTPQTAVPLVMAGHGVAPVTPRMVEHNPALALLPPPDFMPGMRGTLLWRRGAEMTPLMERWRQAAEVLGP